MNDRVSLYEISSSSEELDPEIMKVFNLNNKQKKTKYSIGITTGRVYLNGEKINDENWTIQEKCRVVLGLDRFDPQLVYPSKSNVREFFTSTNLHIVPQNKIITVDNETMYEYNNTIFVSKTRKWFDLISCQYIQHEDNSFVANLVKNTEGIDYYPASLKLHNIMRVDNLMRIEDKYLYIDDKTFVRITGHNDLYICPSDHIEIYSANEFRLLSKLEVNALIQSLTITMQKLAQMILDTNEIVYPKYTNRQAILKSSNLYIPDSASPITINGKKVFETNDNNILIFDNGDTFNKTTFQISEFETKVGESEQDKVRRLMLDNTKTFYPRSTKGKVFHRSNIIELKDGRALINNVQYCQHPYFKNILGTKEMKGNIKLFDLNTFTSPSDEIKYKLPFYRDNTVQINKDFVYNKTTQTINNFPINWDNPLEVQPISKIKYAHPSFVDYFCDFYGNAFRITIDIDEDKELIEPLLILNNNEVIQVGHGKPRSILKTNFVYECFYQTIVPKDRTIETLKNELPQFRYCKWNLAPRATTNEIDMSKVHFHPSPKFHTYCYNEETREIYNTKKCGEFVSKAYSHYVTLADYTLPFNRYNRVTYPTDRFIYEAMNQRELAEDEFLVNGNVIKAGIPEFVMNDIVYRRTNMDEFYIGDDDSIFYIPYSRIVNTAGDYIIISRTNPDRNIQRSLLKRL